MKKPLPPSITELLNTEPAPLVVYDLEIPTKGPVTRHSWRLERRFERMDRANRRFFEEGRDAELPF